MRFNLEAVKLIKMITKMELAEMLSELWINIPNLYKKRIIKIMGMDDHLFIPWIKQVYNWNLTIIRKNLYTVN